MSAMVSEVEWATDNRRKTSSEPNDTVPLPLNLIALVISYLDEPADLARACRTCRILHYMCLPQLYSRVSLHSYDHIRFIRADKRPEGWGGASPFSMGLNALVTRNVACYVKTFKVWGKWKDIDLEECSKVGRVPDASMMLNLLVRTAIDKMPVLESFCWELDTKMLPIVWLGLAQKKSLEHLTIQFPSIRYPRPTLTVPPIPNLKYLHLKEIDPLCYPDNVSLLLLNSKKLEHLKMHWSPRMREAREPSINLHSYFGKTIAAQYKMRLKSLAVQNLYAYNEADFAYLFDEPVMESITFLTSIGGAEDADNMTFVDYSWTNAQPKRELTSVRSFRGDRISSHDCVMLQTFGNLQFFYLVTGRKPRDRPYESRSESGSNGSAEETHSGLTFPRPTSRSPFTPVTPIEQLPVAKVGKECLESLCGSVGARLKHVLLMPQWRYSADDIARLVRCCPLLEQLGIGVEANAFQALRLLIPFLPQLYAIRILDAPNDWALSDHLSHQDDEWQEEAIGSETGLPGWERLRWVGFGDWVFEIIPGTRIEREVEGGGVRFMKRVKKRTWESVKDVEIWSLDKVEL